MYSRLAILADREYVKGKKGEKTSAPRVHILYGQAQKLQIKYLLKKLGLRTRAAPVRYAPKNGLPSGE